MPKHRQVLVRVRSWEAYIDEKIVPLIRELWEAGIRTTNSCQENRKGIVWIQFTEPVDAACFLNLVTCYDESFENLYKRVTLQGDNRKHSPGCWEYTIHPSDSALQVTFDPDDSTSRSHPGRPEFHFSVSIRFPRDDYPVVLQRMTDFNNKRKVGNH